MPSKKNFQPKREQEALQVSFLPSSVTDESRAIVKRQKILILIFALAIAVPLLIWGFLLVRINLVKSDIKTAEADGTKIEKNLLAKTVELNEVRALSNRIAPVKAILQKHAFWSNFFKALEENTLVGVVYNSLAFDEKSVILTGTAKDYETIARQMVVFKTAPAVKDVKVSGLASQISPKGEITGVNFSFSIVLNQDIFRPSF